MGDTSNTVQNNFTQTFFYLVKQFYFNAGGNSHAPVEIPITVNPWDRGRVS